MEEEKKVSEEEETVKTSAGAPAEDSSKVADDAKPADDAAHAGDAKAEAEPPKVDAADIGAAKEAEQVPAEPNWKDRYLRTMADFDNYRKRVARDREDVFKQAEKDVLKDILETLDSLEKALDAAKEAEDPLVKGVRMVHDNFVKTLEKHGATPLASVGEPLDPEFHRALAQMPSDTVPEGHIISEFKKGWLLNGKLLREAQVVVSSGKAE